VYYVYQSIRRRSLKNPPVGPFAGNVAAQTIVSAPRLEGRAPRPGADQSPKTPEYTR